MDSNMMQLNNFTPNVSGWILESGYVKPYDADNYPYQGSTLLGLTDLNIVLEALANDFEPKCGGVRLGYKIVLSMPGEAVKMSQNYFQLPPKTRNVFIIYAEWTRVGDTLRRFKPNQRKCFYTDERRLRFFKIYTKTNCEVECLANFTKNLCACVNFAMPSMHNYVFS